MASTQSVREVLQRCEELAAACGSNRTGEKYAELQREETKLRQLCAELAMNELVAKERIRPLKLSTNGLTAGLESLEKEVVAIQKRFDAADSREKSLERLSTGLQAKVNELESEAQKVSKEQGERRNTLREKFSTELQTISTSLESLITQRHELAEKKTAVVKKLQELTSQLLSNNDESEKLAAEVETLRTRDAEAQSVKSTESEVIEGAEGDKQSDSAPIAAEEELDEEAKKKAEMAAAEAELDAIFASASPEQIEERTRLQSEISQSETRLQELQTKIIAVNQELTEFASKFVVAQAELRAVQEENAQEEQKVAELTESVQNAEKSHKARITRITAQLETSRVLSSQYTEKQAEVDKALRQALKSLDLAMTVIKQVETSRNM